MTNDQESIEDSGESLYDEEGREESLDNDEISAQEEAFMKGYDEATEHKKKQPLPDSEDEEP